MRVLLVKMSSLGDVVHTLAAVTDAVRNRPELQIDWVVEEAYEAIPHWHPAIRRVIPVALRRWRRSPWSMIRGKEWFGFRNELRQEEYDLVLDAQGLMKSGWIALQARGPVSGRSRNSAREPLASAFYNRTHDIDLTLPEVEQVRQLFARALDYPAPDSAAHFGIEGPRSPARSSTADSAVLVHGAAWLNKLWPVENWIQLAQELSRQGLRILLPWGNDEERTRAQRIAEVCRGEVLPKCTVDELARVIAGAKLVVGLDTGLTHIAIALQRPTVTLYGPSVPVYGAVAGNQVVHLVSSPSRFVDTSRKNTVALADVLRAIQELLSAPTVPA